MRNDLALVVTVIPRKQSEIILVQKDIAITEVQLSWANVFVGPGGIYVNGPWGRVDVPAADRERVCAEWRKSTTEHYEGRGCTVAFDDEGWMYVGDRSGTIFKVREGRAVRFATLPPSVAAFHLAMSPAQELFVSANGDTANKIGTYMVAVLAREHGVPFYVAAPLTTLDLSLASGEEIPIEERDSMEVTHIREHQLAPDGIDVHNPAFDVTPNAFITAIITDKGVARPPYVESLKKLLATDNTDKD